MITDIKAVVNTLIVVLFLTMILFSPNIIDMFYFLTLFIFKFKIRI